MARFIYLYKGDATPPEEMGEEQAKEVMGRWASWMGKAGSAMVDVGAPMNPVGASVVDDGSSGQPQPLNGYSIVEAADLNAAKELTKDHPFLSDGNGEFSIEVYELLPIPEFNG